METSNMILVEALQGELALNYDTSAGLLLHLLVVMILLVLLAE